MTKKKTSSSVTVERQDGEWLYKKDKLPYQVYLEAALKSAQTNNIKYVDVQKFFREMMVDAALKDLGYGK